MTWRWTQRDNSNRLTADFSFERTFFTVCHLIVMELILGVNLSRYNCIAPQDMALKQKEKIITWKINSIVSLQFVSWELNLWTYAIWFLMICSIAHQKFLQFVWYSRKYDHINLRLVWFKTNFYKYMHMFMVLLDHPHYTWFTYGFSL